MAVLYRRSLILSSIVVVSTAFTARPLFFDLPPLLSETRLASSIGNNGNKDDPPASGGGGGNSWDDFLNPNKEESANLRKAREYMSDNSLPISFDTEPSDDSFLRNVSQTTDSQPAGQLAWMRPGGELLPGSPSSDMLAQNPYMAVVAKLSPSELISKFTSSTHPRVQNAVRSTILGLIGGLPKMAFDTTTVTTGQRLASLMFQLQMTGYMFKNAEYKLSVQQALAVEDEVGKFSLKGITDNEPVDPLKGKIRGKLRVSYRSKNTMEGDNTVEDAVGGEIEVDAAAYMSELRSEVSKLRDELIVSRKAKEEALRKDLLLYIRTLPEQELRALTSTMSPDVLVAMKGLVNAVISGIGEGQIGPETVTEQSGEAMAQLCLWQLAIGYNLRTLEVREEMKKSLSGFSMYNENPEKGGIFPEPGALE